MLLRRLRRKRLRNKKRNKFFVLMSWSLVALVMVVIYNLSSQVAYLSNSLSEEVTKVMVDTLAPRGNYNIDYLNHILRKSTHFFIFMALGLLFMNAIKVSGGKGMKWLIITVVLCTLYAISDELHQSYVLGRSGETMDVVIDTAGIVTGVGLYYVISLLKDRYIKN